MWDPRRLTTLQASKRIALLFYFNFSEMEVSGQIHAPVTSFRGNLPQVSMEQKTRWAPEPI
jgi:hypothetical protein